VRQRHEEIGIVPGDAQDIVDARQARYFLARQRQQLAQTEFGRPEHVQMPRHVGFQLVQRPLAGGSLAERRFRLG